MRNDRGRDAGFSLIELLVVLAIMSLSAIVIMQSVNFRGHRPSASALSMMIANQARTASLRAISRSTVVMLTIDVKSSAVSISDDENPIVVPKDYLLKVTSGAELKPEENKAVVEFYPDGTSSGGQIEILDRRGNKGAVNINWLTGAISIDEKK